MSYIAVNNSDTYAHVNSASVSSVSTKLSLVVLIINQHLFGYCNTEILQQWLRKIPNSAWQTL